MSLVDVSYIQEHCEKDSYIVLVDSSTRDKAVYPSPSEYSLDFNEPIKLVYGLNILDAMVPNTTYVIDRQNNVITVDFLFTKSTNNPYSFLNEHLSYLSVNNKFQDLFYYFGMENYNIGPTNAFIQQALASAINDGDGDAYDIIDNEERFFLGQVENCNLCSNTYTICLFNDDGNRFVSSGVDSFETFMNNLNYTQGTTLPFNPSDDSLLLDQFIYFPIQITPKSQEASINNTYLFTKEVVYFFVRKKLTISSLIEVSSSVKSYESSTYFVFTSLTKSYAFPKNELFGGQTILSAYQDLLESGNVFVDGKDIFYYDIFWAYKTNSIIPSVYWSLIDHLRRNQSVLNTSYNKLLLMERTQVALPYGNYEYTSTTARYSLLEELRKRINKALAIPNANSTYTFTGYEFEIVANFLTRKYTFATKSTPFIIPIANTSIARQLGLSSYHMNDKSSIYKIYKYFNTQYIYSAIDLSELKSKLPEIRAFKINNSLYMHALIPDGIVNLTSIPYIIVRCKEIEDQIYRNYPNGKQGIGVFKLPGNTNDIAHLRFDFSTFVRKPFHPIGKLSKLTFRFESPEGTLYDFKGIDHMFILSLNFYTPVTNKAFKNYALNPNYNPDYLTYAVDVLKKQHALDAKLKNEALPDLSTYVKETKLYDYVSSEEESEYERNSSNSSNESSEPEDMVGLYR